MPDNDIERRAFQIDEVRVDGADGKPRLVGHAAVFDSLSDDLGGFREKIAPGAFSKSLGGDVRALFNHDPNIVLGRTRSKTLRLSEDSRGLAIEIEPPDTASARGVLESIRRGDVSEMSFAFRTISDTWEETDDGQIRTLNEVELFDVSPVTFPAYPQTDIAARSRDAWRASQAAETPGETHALDRARVRQRQAEAEQ